MRLQKAELSTSLRNCKLNYVSLTYSIELTGKNYPIVGNCTFAYENIAYLDLRNHQIKLMLGISFKKTRIWIEKRFTDLFDRVFGDLWVIGNKLFDFQKFNKPQLQRKMHEIYKTYMHIRIIFTQKIIICAFLS